MNATQPTTLTARESAIVAALHGFQYMQDEEFEVGTGAWGYALVMDIVNLGETKKAATGFISSLVKKGILSLSTVDKDDKWFVVTTEGFAAWQSLQPVAEKAEDLVAAPAEETEALATTPEQDAIAGLTARQRVVKAATKGCWRILGTDLVIPGKRDALRKAAALKRSGL